MPPASRFFEGPHPLAFAHRGGAGEALENSWAAFERAYSIGFRYMETDVRVTSDGVPVAIHDPDLLRVAGEPGAVSGLSQRQLAARRLRDGSSVPLLEELLGAWPEVRWNIDLKQPGAVMPVVEVLERSACLDRVLVGAFSGRRTARARAVLGPGVATGAGRGMVAWLLVARVAPLLSPPRPKASAAQVPPVHLGIRVVDERFVRTCHRLGLAVHVWTIDDPAEMERLLAMGVDGIMTDRPSVLKGVLRDRGQWAVPGS